MTGEANGSSVVSDVNNNTPPPSEPPSLPSKSKAADSSPPVPAKSSSSKSAAPSCTSMGSKKNLGLKNTTTTKGMPQSAKTKEVSLSSDISPHLPPFDAAVEEISGLGLPDWAGEEGIEQNLQSAKWQDRKTGMEMLFRAVECAELLNGHLPALLSVLKQHTKSFKEANFNVFKSFLNGLTSNLLSTYSLPLSLDDKKSLAALLTVVVEKLNDRKLGESISDLFITVGEVVGPQFVIECLVQAAASGIKAPLSRLELLNWMGKFVNAVSIVVDVCANLLPFLHEFVCFFY